MGDQGTRPVPHIRGTRPVPHIRGTRPVPHIRGTRPVPDIRPVALLPFLGRLLAASAIFAAPPAPAHAELDAEDVELRVAIEEQQPEMEATLADWVGRNTGTWNTPGLEAFAPLVGAELARLGFTVKIEPSAALEYPDRKDARVGPVVVAERRASSSPQTARRFFLLGHLATGFEPDSPSTASPRTSRARRPRATARSSRSRGRCSRSSHSPISTAASC